MPSLAPYFSSLAPFVLALAALLPSACFGAACECKENLYVVRQWDELIMNDGSKMVGQVSEQEDGSFKVRDMRTNVGRTVPKNMVRDVRMKATSETELERLSKEFWNNPCKIYCVAVEGTTRFNLNAKVIAMLERFTAANSDEGCLQKLGELYLLANQTDKGLRIADRLIKADPKNPRNLMLHGQALAASDKLDLAEKDLVEAFKLAPTDDNVALAYAEMLLRLGRADDAKKIYSEAVNAAANRRNPMPCTGLGFLDLRSGDFIAAEQNFQQALSINRDFVKAKIGLAAVKLMNKQYDDAFADCNQILNFEPDNPDAYAIQAYARIFKADLNSLNSAENYIKDSLKTKPNQPRLTLAWAVMNDRLAKYEELKSDKERNAALLSQRKNDAQAKFNEVLASDAADGFIQFWIGEKRFREVEEMERSRGIESARAPKDPTLINTALTQAEAAFARAAKLSPRYSPAHGALAATELRLKKYPEARAAFAKAAETAPPQSADAADYIAGQGLCLLKSEKFDEAKQFFSNALAANPQCVAALCGRGYIANWERDKSAAMDNFRRALAADGDCSYAANALQAIFKQDDREMDYVRFIGTDWPRGWKPRAAGGSIKITMDNGQALYSGTQGANMGNKLEVSKDYLNGGAFERLEADLQISPDSPVIYGLRIASGSGPNPAFEFEFGKDESNEIKVRYRDANGIQPAWSSTKNEWPKTQRVRLGIDTDGIVMGDSVFRLWINGRKVAEATCKFPNKPSRLSLGVFLQAPPKEVVNATVNNIVVVKRGVAEGGGPEIQQDIKLVTDPPPNAPAPTPPVPK